MEILHNPVTGANKDGWQKFANTNTGIPLKQSSTKQKRPLLIKRINNTSYHLKSDATKKHKINTLVEFTISMFNKEICTTKGYKKDGKFEIFHPSFAVRHPTKQVWRIQDFYSQSPNNSNCVFKKHKLFQKTTILYKINCEEERFLHISKNKNEPWKPQQSSLMWRTSFKKTRLQMR